MERSIIELENIFANICVSAYPLVWDDYQIIYKDQTQVRPQHRYSY